jgi:hypothetical protein
VLEHYFLPPARRAFEYASAADQEQFDRIFDELCEDPSLNPPLKDRFDVPPVVISRYHDGIYWVVYDLPDEAALRVWMIGKAPQAPGPY